MRALRTNWILPIAALLLLWADGLARSANEEIVGRMSPLQRKQLEIMNGLGIAGLTELQEITVAEQLRERTAALISLGNTAIGSRPIDEQGRSPLHRHILAEIERLAPYGVEFLGSLRGSVAAPVALDQRGDPALRGPRAAIEVDGQQWQLAPLWPNGAMPSLAPEAGLQGPLLYVRRAEWADLNGIDLAGSIAVMDFSGGRNLERLFSLGAVAVIVIDDGNIQYERASLLFSATPLPFPRYYIDARSGTSLVELAAANVVALRAGGSARSGVVRGGHVYENRPIESLFAYLPPGPPVVFPVQAHSLLELVAADYGITADELSRANQLTDPWVQPGQRLLIPGGRGSYTVREDELLNRVALLYGTSAAAIRAASGLDPRAQPEIGSELTIPNADSPIVITLPIDTASVVPDLPHGARAMANLAAGLLLMDNLATSRMVNRRRGVVFAFMDGDTLGGQASRLLAEYVYVQENEFSVAGGSRGLSDEQRLQRYRDARVWFTDGTAPADTETARWLVQDWLMGHLEDARVRLAEQRIPVILQINATSDADELAELNARRDAIEAELRTVVDARLDSLARRVPPQQQLDLLSDIFADPQRGPTLAAYGLSREQLGARFLLELEEEERASADHHGNLEFAGKLLRTIRGRQVGGLRMGIHLDLLDGSHHLSTNIPENAELQLRSAPRASSLQRRLAPRLRSVAAYAATLAGWPQQATFVSTEDRATLALLPTRLPPIYDDFWRFADVVLLPIGGTSDRTPLLDTPADTLDSIRFDNFSVQARTAFTLVRLAVESPLDSAIDFNINRPELARVSGRAVQFNIRSGIDARDPVPGTYVYLPFSSSDAGRVLSNAEGFYGYRRGVVATTRLNGSFRMPVEIPNYHPRPRIFAYRLNTESAVFDKVMTQGQVGTRGQQNVFQYRRSGELERNLVMIDVWPLVIFPGEDPHEYIPVGGSPRGPVQINLIDAVRNGEPRDFAVDNVTADFREKDLDSAVLYLPPGRRVQAMVRKGLNFRMMLVGELDRSTNRARGQGHRVGPDPEGGRNLYLTHTPLRIAEEMTALARHRLDVYRRFGISAVKLDEAVRRGEEKVIEARAAMSAHNWREAIGASREAWGILVKNYPRILGLGREAVFSVILLMAFLVPTAWFLQALFTKARGIVAQLGWAVGFFAAGTLFLNTFHPAFRIALSPFIVVIAFTMILMSTIVIGLAYQRFEILLRRFRSASGQVESEEISLFSSLATAFSLGISNLRKRMFRTILTVLTVTALTFSIVAFVAVSGSDTVSRQAVPLDTYLEGDFIEPEAPAYNGLLMRQFNWQPLAASRLVALETEFGGRMELAVRSHYIQAEGGNNAVREGVNQIPLVHEGRRHIVTGVMVLPPNEPRFSGLNRAVSNGEWFRGEQQTASGWVAAERFSMILPDVAAEHLGISERDIFTTEGQRRPDAELPEVTMMGHRWRVIGILDTAYANRIRDVNGRSLAMVDYLRSGMSNSVSGKLEQEGDSFHANWERFVIVPSAAREDVGAQLRSIALRFDDGADTEAFFRDIALRLKDPFFFHSGGEISFVVPRQKIDLAGVAKVLLPVVLCILIVMNTMLGTVEERKGEVGMLGAIGLSPRQISFLMFSESTVFSVLGILLGTFSGLLFSNLVQGLNARHIDFLSGLSFNFTSMLSMMLATGTGAVVLLATLIPARQAAALAAPSGMAAWVLPPPGADGTIQFDLPFTLTRGNAVGMAAFMRRFLLNHTESTSEDFNCREVVLSGSDGESPAIFLEAAMWLMPYDLDVAQHFRLRLSRGGTEGVFAVHLQLTRFSGSEDNWMRTAYQFLNLVRQQFLLWRNLAPEARARYIEEGAELIRNLPMPEGQTS